MCKVIEDMCNQVSCECAMEIARRMLAAGRYSLEEIADITELSLDEVRKLQAEQSA